MTARKRAAAGLGGPRLAEASGNSALYCDVAIIVVAVVRIRAAARPQRRALAAVAAASLLFLPPDRSAFAFSAAVLDIDVNAGDAVAWASWPPA